MSLFRAAEMAQWVNACCTSMGTWLRCQHPYRKGVNTKSQQRGRQQRRFSLLTAGIAGLLIKTPFSNTDRGSIPWQDYLFTYLLTYMFWARVSLCNPGWLGQNYIFRTRWEISLCSYDLGLMFRAVCDGGTCRGWPCGTRGPSRRHPSSRYLGLAGQMCNICTG